MAGAKPSTSRSEADQEEDVALHSSALARRARDSIAPRVGCKPPHACTFSAKKPPPCFMLHDDLVEALLKD